MTDKITPRIVKSHDVHLDSEYVQWIYKDQTEVQWSFKGIQTPIGVASYDNVQNFNFIPDFYIERQLGSYFEGCPVLFLLY